MNDTTNTRTELGASRDIIRDYMETLATYGFAPRNIEISHNNQTGDAITCVFVKEAAGLSMEIVYHPTLNNNRRYIAVTITKSGEEDKLYLEQYLTSHHRSDILNYFVDQGRVLDLREFWSNFFGVLEVLFKDELKPIITGERWDGAPYDWDGYR